MPSVDAAADSWTYEAVKYEEFDLDDTIVEMKEESYGENIESSECEEKAFKVVHKDALSDKVKLNDYVFDER